MSRRSRMNPKPLSKTNEAMEKIETFEQVLDTFSALADFAQRTTERLKSDKPEERREGKSIVVAFGMGQLLLQNASNELLRTAKELIEAEEAAPEIKFDEKEYRTEE